MNSHMERRFHPAGNAIISIEAFFLFLLSVFFTGPDMLELCFVILEQDSIF
jgi:hypothetical protein